MKKLFGSLLAFGVVALLPALMGLVTLQAQDEPQRFGIQLAKKYFRVKEKNLTLKIKELRESNF